MKYLSMFALLLFMSSCVPAQNRNKNNVQTQNIKESKMKAEKIIPTDTITLGGGCFWCIEAVFQRLKGVSNVKSGYAGGTKLNPTYDDICTGMTGHAEVVQVYYDRNIISLEDLLYVFWRLHNPTTLNRQGNDIGTQYRSAIYYTKDSDAFIIQNSKIEAEKKEIWRDKFVTEVKKLDKFYPAEVKHDDYYNRNKGTGYCSYVIDPKIKKLEKKYSEYMKEEYKEEDK